MYCDSNELIVWVFAITRRCLRAVAGVLMMENSNDIVLRFDFVLQRQEQEIARMIARQQLELQAEVERYDYDGAGAGGGGGGEQHQHLVIQHHNHAPSPLILIPASRATSSKCTPNTPVSYSATPRWLTPLSILRLTPLSVLIAKEEAA